jgi:hypothetical protein
VTRTSRPAHPWADVAVLLVDGNNLLHAVAGNAGPASLRGLLPRLTAAVPTDVDTLVVLDGPPDPGGPARVRIRRGLTIRHAGRIGADAVIVAVVEERTFADRAGTLVVTNDVALGDEVRRIGGRVRPVRWLQERLDEPPVVRPPGASIAGPWPGRGRIGTAQGGAPTGRHRTGSGRTAGEAGAAPGTEGTEDGEQDATRPAWAPGRGATRKRGNPRRGH